MNLSKPALTEHERIIQELLMDLSDKPGFPDNERKLDNVTRAYARFAQTEPYKVSTLPHLRPFLSEEEIQKELAPHKWKDGVVPAAWLVTRIADTCKFFPSPIEARRIYCKAGWPTVDGQTDSIAEDLPRETGE